MRELPGLAPLPGGHAPCFVDRWLDGRVAGVELLLWPVRRAWSGHRGLQDRLAFWPGAARPAARGEVEFHLISRRYDALRAVDPEAALWLHFMAQVSAGEVEGGPPARVSVRVYAGWARASAASATAAHAHAAEVEPEGLGVAVASRQDALGAALEFLHPEARRHLDDFHPALRPPRAKSPRELWPQEKLVTVPSDATALPPGSGPFRVRFPVTPLPALESGCFVGCGIAALGAMTDLYLAPLGLVVALAITLRSMVWWLVIWRSARRALEDQLARLQLETARLPARPAGEERGRRLVRDHRGGYWHMTSNTYRVLNEGACVLTLRQAPPAEPAAPRGGRRVATDRVVVWVLVALGVIASVVYLLARP